MCSLLISDYQQSFVINSQIRTNKISSQMAESDTSIKTFRTFSSVVTSLIKIHYLNGVHSRKPQKTTFHSYRLFSSTHTNAHTPSHCPALSFQPILIIFTLNVVNTASDAFARPLLFYCDLLLYIWNNRKHQVSCPMIVKSLTGCRDNQFNGVLLLLQAPVCGAVM